MKRKAIYATVGSGTWPDNYTQSRRVKITEYTEPVPGLAVHRPFMSFMPKRMWQITHIPTGCRISSRGFYRRKATAVAVAVALGKHGDWTLGEKEIVKLVALLTKKGVGRTIIARHSCYDAITGVMKKEPR